MDGCDEVAGFAAQVGDSVFVLGDGPLESALRGQISDLKLEDQVHLTGPLGMDAIIGPEFTGAPLPGPPASERRVGLAPPSSRGAGVRFKLAW
jgi:hypothetical protein